MATSCLNAVRVRLYFDYPPPATPECRMCWLLVDLNKCRVIADLSSIIKEKFGYSRKTSLDLFIEDCYLPSTESIYIVRDNDSIRVKVCSPVYGNGAEACQNSEAHISKTKKRVREDETQISESLSKKKKPEDVNSNASAPAENGKKKKKKKKKKEVKESATKPATPQNNIASPSSSKNNRKSTSADAISDKTTRTKNHEPTSSASDSSEDEPHKKAPPPKPKSKQNGATKKPPVAARKESTSSDSSSSGAVNISKSGITVQPLPGTPKPSCTNSKLLLQTPQCRESSTDSSSSSSSSSSQIKPVGKKSQAASQPSSTTHNSVQSVSSSVSKEPQDNAESSDSDASEIELVIKKPNLQGMGLKIAGVRPCASEAAGRDRGNTRGQERGRGRGANRGNWRGDFGRARGTPWKQDSPFERQKQNDSLTNESFILQNPPEPAPKRDYTALPLLAAPPAVGQKIAFKLLELTENYTPEVSNYKEGKIIAFNPQTNVMELELLSQPQAPVEPGKFDLVYQNPDGSEIVEYAVTHGSQLTERWDSLLEPRLIVENVG
ncbi:coilin [Pimephales promelas]|uniref:coilin n=1 Tax=Pimephales promelas TaxID=90988 RepID=UPI0019557ADC|nr:coilin [Pimephales promelas]KAG1968324.1 coilin [Pimephales promelas]